MRAFAGCLLVALLAWPAEGRAQDGPRISLRIYEPDGFFDALSAAETGSRFRFDSRGQYAPVTELRGSFGALGIAIRNRDGDIDADMFLSRGRWEFEGRPIDGGSPLEIEGFLFRMSRPIALGW